MIDPAGARRQVVFVLGMHRSGTSALTRIIGLLGAALPETPIDADENNPSGYWEPAGINALDDRLLAMAGSSWDDFRALDLAQLPEGSLDGFREQIAAELEEQFRAGPLIVVKDPRIARMVPLYAEAARRVGAEARYVLPIRRPSAVAQSLHRRDGMSTAYAGLLWIRHVVDAEAATRGAPRSILDVDRLPVEWRGLVARMSGDISLSWPSGIEEASGEIETFLKPGLWHAAPHGARFPVDGPLGRLVDETHAAMLELVGNPADGAEIRARLDALRAQLDAAGPDILAAAFEQLQVQRARLGSGAAEARRRADQAVVEAAALSAAEARASEAVERSGLLSLERSRLEQDVAEARTLAADLSRDLAARQESLASQERDLVALRAELSDLSGRAQATAAAHAAELQSLGDQLSAARADSGALQQRIVGLERELGERQAAMSRLEQKVLERDGDLLAAVARAEASGLEGATLASERDEARRSLERLEGRMERAQAAMAALDLQIADRERALALVRRQLQAEATASDADRAALTSDLSRLESDQRRAWALVEESHRLATNQRRVIDAMGNDLRRLEARPAARLGATLGVFIGRDVPSTETMELAVTPANQIEVEGEQDSLLSLVMTGDDPSLLLAWQGGALWHGFYELSFALPSGVSALRGPKLYADTGSGFSESEAIPLFPVGGDAARFVARFSLNPYTVALRLDPSTAPGRLVMGAVRLRPLTRLAYYSALARSVAADRRRTEGSVWPSLRRAFGILRREGLLRGSATLRARIAARGALDGSAPRTLRIDPAPRYVPRSEAAPLENPVARVIAFYLPQFHPIPLNDRAWGEGFTEWTNVRPAEAQFVGHYQPHEPDAELGYYDLRDPGVQRRQVELARLYGVGGFCFYFYWFGGERILETPILNYLADESLDLPFCLCWANENWSRRWDGLESEILIAQQHSADDDIAFIAYVAKYLRDPRYIRIDGRPVLLVYRPNLLPDMRATARRWRDWCRQNGIGEIYLAYTQSFEARDPRDYGLDGAIEFPPNNSGPPDITDLVTPARADFSGKVYDWSALPDRSRAYARPDYPLFRGVNPGWDNTARRKAKGTIFANSTPALYEEWLGNALADTRERFSTPDERLVFVNAWNEWAEGAHLEPDRRYGYAWLDATRRALERAARASRRVVIVTHDAHPHGAQLLALHMARQLSGMGFVVDIVALEGGPLLDSYAAAGRLHRLAPTASAAEIDTLLSRLRAQGADLAIANTTVSGRIVPALKSAGFATVSLIHELPGLLAAYGLADEARAIARQADAVVFPAEMVRDGFEAFIGEPLAQARIRPQGSYLQSPYRFLDDRTAVRARIRAALDLPADARIVFSAGYADRRKGVDLFVAALLGRMPADPLLHGVWIGHADSGLLAEQQAIIARAGMAGRFRFPGRVEAPQDYYAAADVYALTSREDPFPSVVMESLDARVTVVMFAGTGGAEELLARGAGIVVPAFDTTAFGAAVARLAADPAEAARLGAAGHDIVVREFGFRTYLFDLLAIAGRPLPTVSVIVPNYNYARYIEARLDSIGAQTHAVYELIVLDDASTDDSVDRIARWLGASPLPAQLVVNAENSGSVFRQWAKGVAMARGDYVWIAEADDLSDPEFLATALEALVADPAAVMSYTQSKMIDGDGQVTAPDYLGYVADLDADRWRQPFVAEGRDEVAAGLFLKNTVPNVSAALFRREALAAVLDAHLDEIASYRNAGDWMAYLRLMERGGLAFSPRALNLHRRHAGSVTLGSANLRHLREIMAVQRQAIARFGLGSDEEAQALDYAQRIYEQFGLATPEHPRVDMHPELAAD